jgi:hypothetical protein
MSDALETTIAAVRHNGKQRTIRCPAHDDKTPSLSVGRGKNGGIVLHCKAGCDTADVLKAAGLTWADVSPPKTEGTIVATYDYKTLDETLSHQSVRYDPKAFKVRRPDGAGDYIWDMGGVADKHLPYRLPELKGRDLVFVVEGERDADRLWSLDIPATTNIFGALKWTKYESKSLVAAGVTRVVIIPDNDEPGKEHAERVRESVRAVATIIELPGLPEHGDVSDWLSSGNTADDMKALVTAAETVPATPDDIPVDGGPATPSQATRLVDLALKADVETWHAFPFTAEIETILKGQLAEHERLKRAGTLCPFVFQRDGERIMTFRKAWAVACAQAGCPGKLIHDMRRSVVRTFERAGVPRSVAMSIVGHKTESIYRRYTIVDEAMQREAAVRLDIWTASSSSHGATATVATIASRATRPNRRIRRS